MQYFQLKTGDEIPAIGFGTYTLTGAEGVEMIRKALEFGYRHLDTAEAYNNQPEIAEAIKKSRVSRKDIFLTSKVWHNHLRGEEVKKACEKILEELKTDYLDLYLIHWPNPRVSVKETLQAMNELKKEGKIKNIGVSNFTVSHLEEMKEVSDVKVINNQVEYHPYFNRKDLLEYCREMDIILSAYSPVGRGEVFEDPVLKKIGKDHGKNEAQITLKWMVQKGIVVLPRSANPEHIAQNIDLFGWELEPAEMKQIDNIQKEKRLIEPPIG
ncbi:MAG: aldo/keto reductase [Halanaerobiales bacterium]